MSMLPLAIHANRQSTDFTQIRLESSSKCRAIWTMSITQWKNSRCYNRNWDVPFSNLHKDRQQTTNRNGIVTIDQLCLQWSTGALKRTPAGGLKSFVSHWKMNKRRDLNSENYSTIISKMLMWSADTDAHTVRKLSYFLSMKRLKEKGARTDPLLQPGRVLTFDIIMKMSSLHSLRMIFPNKWKKQLCRN